MEQLSTSHLLIASRSLQEGDYETAEHRAKVAISIDPRCAGAFHILGMIRCMQGALAEAEEFLLKAAGLSKKNSYIFFNLAKCLSDQDKDTLALKWHRKTIELNRNSSDAWLNYGISLAKVGKLKESLSAFNYVIRVLPDDSRAWSNKTTTLLRLGELDAALECSKHTIELSPSSTEGWKIHGVLSEKLELHDQALEAYRLSLKLNPNQADTWLLLGKVLYDKGQLNEALDSFSMSISLDPTASEFFLNRGAVLEVLHRLEDSIADYRTAKSLDSENPLTHFALGSALTKKGLYFDALNSYEEAIDRDPDYEAAWHNKGATLFYLKRYEDAIKSFTRAVTLKPKENFNLGSLLHAKMQIADWSDFTTYLEQIRNGLKRRDKVVIPFVAISLFDSPALLKTASEISSTYRFKHIRPIDKRRPRNSSERIRIAYFSMDFCEHPVSYLIAELFELHDRNCFELYGFSLGVDTQDPIRKRIEASFDHFIDVCDLDTNEIALVCQELSLDIAIDLGGFTKGSRPEIFAKRIAPTQINYLGFPSTMGNEYYDYIVADPTLIPLESQEFFTEKIIYLPNCYQVNDRKRTISKHPGSRSVHGLPEQGFVYCCFNNSWKILPEQFDIWMKILKRVENSVLWFREVNLYCSKNLKSEAAKQGIDPDRLVFAGYVAHDIHLARYRLADLFLDTYPYNGHTTASDALWAGLPVLTIEGSTYAARVGSSLLRNLGVEELVTKTRIEYLELAIELSENRSKLIKLRENIERNRVSFPLFDTPLFTSHIEAAYKAAYRAEHSNAIKDHIYIKL
jgi:protein O-GlcNAc transferase